MKRRTKTFVSVVTLFIFTVNQLILPERGFASAKPFSEVNLGIEGFSAFTIPPHLGTVQNLIPGNGPTLVHIQTAHGHYEAQKKIEAILHYLKETYGFKTLFVEGSAFKLEPEILRFFPERMDLTSTILDELTKKAIVQGPDLFLAGEKEAEAYGIEDLKTYLKNRQAFKETLIGRKKTDKFLNLIDREMEDLLGQLNKELRSFIRRYQTFEVTKELPMEDWLSYLKRESTKKLSLDLSDSRLQIEWPMLVRLFKLQKFEREFDQTAYVKEKERFLKIIHRIPQDIHAQIERLLDSEISHHELPDPETGLLFEKMVALLPQVFDFDSFPNVKLFIGHLILQSELKSDLLLNEIKLLAQKLESSFVGTDEEKKILTLFKNYWLLKKLFGLELTPDEYEIILNRKENFEPAQIIKEILKLKRGGRVEILKSKYLQEIESLFGNAGEFYRLAKERDQLMLENVQKKMKENHVKKAVVITGGFHSKPFKDFFEAQGFRYTLISPKIASSAKKGRETYIRSILDHTPDLPRSTLADVSPSDPHLSLYGIDSVKWWHNPLRRAARHIFSTKKIDSSNRKELTLQLIQQLAPNRSEARSESSKESIHPMPTTRQENDLIEPVRYEGQTAPKRYLLDGIQTGPKSDRKLDQVPRNHPLWPGIQVIKKAKAYLLSEVLEQTKKNRSDFLTKLDAELKNRNITGKRDIALRLLFEEFFKSDILRRGENISFIVLGNQPGKKRFIVWQNLLNYAFLTVSVDRNAIRMREGGFLLVYRNQKILAALIAEGLFRLFYHTFMEGKSAVGEKYARLADAIEGDEQLAVEIFYKIVDPKDLVGKRIARFVRYENVSKKERARRLKRESRKLISEGNLAVDTLHSVIHPFKYHPWHLYLTEINHLISKGIIVAFRKEAPLDEVGFRYVTKASHRQLRKKVTLKEDEAFHLIRNLEATKRKLSEELETLDSMNVRGSAAFKNDIKAGGLKRLRELVEKDLARIIRSRGVTHSVIPSKAYRREPLYFGGKEREKQRFDSLNLIEKYRRTTLRGNSTHPVQIFGDEDVKFIELYLSEIKVAVDRGLVIAEEWTVEKKDITGVVFESNIGISSEDLSMTSILTPEEGVDLADKIARKYPDIESELTENDFLTELTQVVDLSEADYRIDEARRIILRDRIHVAVRREEGKIKEVAFIRSEARVDHTEKVDIMEKYHYAPAVIERPWQYGGLGNFESSRWGGMLDQIISRVGDFGDKNLPLVLLFRFHQELEESLSLSAKPEIMSNKVDLMGWLSYVQEILKQESRKAFQRQDYGHAALFNIEKYVLWSVDIRPVPFRSGLARPPETRDALVVTVMIHPKEPAFEIGEEAHSEMRSQESGDSSTARPEVRISKPELSPSLLAVVKPNMTSTEITQALIEATRKAKEAGVKSVHFDAIGPKSRIVLADNPQITTHLMTPENLRAIKAAVPDIKVDVHLMVEDVDEKTIERFIDAGANSIALHYEGYTNDKVLEDRLLLIDVSSKGRTLPSLAFTPAADEKQIDKMAKFLYRATVPQNTFVLALSVPPGAGGQPFDPATLDKMRALVKKGYRGVFHIDGGVNPETAKTVRQSRLPVVSMVAGSAFYRKKGADTVEELRKTFSDFTAAVAYESQVDKVLQEMPKEIALISPDEKIKVEKIWREFIEQGLTPRTEKDLLTFKKALTRFELAEPHVQRISDRYTLSIVGIIFLGLVITFLTPHMPVGSEFVLRYAFFGTLGILALSTLVYLWKHSKVRAPYRTLHRLVDKITQSRSEVRGREETLEELRFAMVSPEKVFSLLLATLIGTPSTASQIYIEGTQEEAVQSPTRSEHRAEVSATKASADGKRPADISGRAEVRSKRSKPIEPRVGTVLPETRFRLGAFNGEEEIKSLRSWPEYKERVQEMQPGKLSNAGFLGKGEDLVDVLLKDHRTLVKLDVTPDQLAEWLEKVITRDKARMYFLRMYFFDILKVAIRFLFVLVKKGWHAAIEGLRDETLHRHATINGQRIEVDSASSSMGSQEPPLPGIPTSSDEYTLINVTTGFRLSGIVTEMHPALIRSYGFFEGNAIRQDLIEMSRDKEWGWMTKKTFGDNPSYRLDPVELYVLFTGKPLESLNIPPSEYERLKSVQKAREEDEHLYKQSLKLLKHMKTQISEKTADGTLAEFLIEEVSPELRIFFTSHFFENREQIVNFLARFISLAFERTSLSIAREQTALIFKLFFTSKEIEEATARINTFQRQRELANFLVERITSKIGQDLAVEQIQVTQIVKIIFASEANRAEVSATKASADGKRPADISGRAEVRNWVRIVRPGEDERVAKNIAKLNLLLLSGMADEANKDKHEVKPGSHPTASASMNDILWAVLNVMYGQDHITLKPHAQLARIAYLYQLGMIDPDQARAEVLMHHHRDSAVPDPDPGMDELIKNLDEPTRELAERWRTEMLKGMDPAARENLDQRGFIAYPSTEGAAPAKITTGPVGLEAANTIALARIYKMLKEQGKDVPPNIHFWILIGDAQTDEGNYLEILNKVVRYGLNNVTIVIDNNRMSLDGDRDKFDEQELAHRHARWKYIELRWGRKIKEEFNKNPGGAVFKRFMEEMTALEYAYLLFLAGRGEDLRKLILRLLDDSQSGEAHDLRKTKDAFGWLNHYTREEKDALKSLIEGHMTDESHGSFYEIFTDLGGHDLAHLTEHLAKARADETKPYVFNAHTIKGKGLESLVGNPRNHSMLVGSKELGKFADRLRRELPVEGDGPFPRFKAGTAEADELVKISKRLQHEENVREIKVKENLSAYAASLPKDDEWPTAMEFPMLQRTSGGIIPTLVALDGILAELVKVSPGHPFKPFVDGLSIFTADVARSMFPSLRNHEYGNPLAKPPLFLDELLKNHRYPFVTRSLQGKIVPVGLAEATAWNHAMATGKSPEFTGFAGFGLMGGYGPFTLGMALNSARFSQYWKAPVLAVGGPAGAATAAEGGSHQFNDDVATALSIPNTMVIETTFPDELLYWLPVIIRHMMTSIVTRDFGGWILTYLRTSLAMTMRRNDLWMRLDQQKLYEGILKQDPKAKEVSKGQPATFASPLAREHWRKEVTGGGYDWINFRGYTVRDRERYLREVLKVDDDPRLHIKQPADYDPTRNVINILVSGPVANEAKEASDAFLRAGIFANVKVITSPSELMKQDFAQAKILFPPKERSRTPVVAVADGPPPYHLSIGPLAMGAGVATLGIRKNGLSTRSVQKIYRALGVSRISIFLMGLSMLYHRDVPWGPVARWLETFFPDRDQDSLARDMELLRKTVSARAEVSATKASADGKQPADISWRAEVREKDVVGKPYHVDLSRIDQSTWIAKSGKGRYRYKVKQLSELTPKKSSKEPRGFKGHFTQIVIAMFVGVFLMDISHKPTAKKVTTLLLSKNNIIGGYIFELESQELLALVVDEKYRGTGAVDILLEDMRERVFGGDSTRKFKGEIHRKSDRVRQRHFYGTLDQFKEAFGIISNTRIHDKRLRAEVSATKSSADGEQPANISWRAEVRIEQTRTQELELINRAVSDLREDLDELLAYTESESKTTEIIHKIASWLHYLPDVLSHQKEPLNMLLDRLQRLNKDSLIPQGYLLQASRSAIYVNQLHLIPYRIVKEEPRHVSDAITRSYDKFYELGIRDRIILPLEESPLYFYPISGRQARVDIPEAVRVFHVEQMTSRPHELESAMGWSSPENDYVIINRDAIDNVSSMRAGLLRQDPTFQPINPSYLPPHHADLMDLASALIRRFISSSRSFDQVLVAYRDDLEEAVVIHEIEHKRVDRVVKQLGVEQEDLNQVATMLGEMLSDSHSLAVSKEPKQLLADYVQRAVIHDQDFHWNILTLLVLLDRDFINRQPNVDDFGTSLLHLLFEPGTRPQLSTKQWLLEQLHSLLDSGTDEELLARAKNTYRLVASALDTYFTAVRAYRLMKQKNLPSVPELVQLTLKDVASWSGFRKLPFVPVGGKLSPSEPGFDPPAPIQFKVPLKKGIYLAHPSVSWLLYLSLLDETGQFPSDAQEAKQLFHEWHDLRMRAGFTSRSYLFVDAYLFFSNFDRYKDLIAKITREWGKDQPYGEWYAEHGPFFALQASTGAWHQILTMDRLYVAEVMREHPDRLRISIANRMLMYKLSGLDVNKGNPLRDFYVSTLVGSEQTARTLDLTYQGKHYREPRFWPVFYADLYFPEFDPRWTISADGKLSHPEFNELHIRTIRNTWYKLNPDGMKETEQFPFLEELAEESLEEANQIMEKLTGMNLNQSGQRSEVRKFWQSLIKNIRENGVLIGDLLASSVVLLFVSAWLYGVAYFGLYLLDELNFIRENYSPPYRDVKIREVLPLLLGVGFVFLASLGFAVFYVWTTYKIFQIQRERKVVQGKIAGLAEELMEREKLLRDEAAKQSGEDMKQFSHWIGVLGPPVPFPKGYTPSWEEFIAEMKKALETILAPLTDPGKSGDIPVDEFLEYLLKLQKLDETLIRLMKHFPARDQEELEIIRDYMNSFLIPRLNAHRKSKDRIVNLLESTKDMPTAEVLPITIKLNEKMLRLSDFPFVHQMIDHYKKLDSALEEIKDNLDRQLGEGKGNTGRSEVRNNAKVLLETLGKHYLIQDLAAMMKRARKGSGELSILGRIDYTGGFGHRHLWEVNSVSDLAEAIRLLKNLISKEFTDSGKFYFLRFSNFPSIGVIVIPTSLIPPFQQGGKPDSFRTRAEVRSSEEDARANEEFKRDLNHLVDSSLESTNLQLWYFIREDFNAGTITVSQAQQRLYETAHYFTNEEQDRWITSQDALIRRVIGKSLPLEKESFRYLVDQLINPALMQIKALNLKTYEEYANFRHMIGGRPLEEGRELALGVIEEYASLFGSEKDRVSIERIRQISTVFPSRFENGDLVDWKIWAPDPNAQEGQSYREGRIYRKDHPSVAADLQANDTYKLTGAKSAETLGRAEVRKSERTSYSVPRTSEKLVAPNEVQRAKYDAPPFQRAELRSPSRWKAESYRGFVWYVYNHLGSMSETKQKVLRRLKWGFYSLEAVAWALRILTWLQIWSGPVGMDFIATGIFYSVLVFIGPFGLIRFSSLGLTKFYFWTKSFLKPSELKGFIKGGSMAVTLIPIGIGMAASLAIQALDMTAGEGIDLRKIALKVYRRALRKKENFKKAFRSVFDLEWARFIARNRFKIAYQILKYQSQYLGKEEFRIRYAELGDDTFDYLQGGKHFLFIGTEKAYEKLRDHRIPTRLKKGRWRIKDKTIDEKIKERFYVLDLIALKRALDGNQNLKPEAFIKPLFESEGERRSEVRGGRIVGWPKLKELLTAQSGSHEIVVNQGLNIIYRALGGVISKGVQAVEPTFSVEAEITGEESLVQVLVVRNDQTQELGIFNISGDNIKLVDSIKDSVIDFTLTQDPRGSPRLVVATTEGDSFFLTFGYPIKIRLYGFELSGELTPMRLSNEEYVLAAMRQHEIYRITEEGELFIPMSRNHGEVSYSLMDGSTRAEVRKAVDYTQSDRLDLTKLQIPAKLEPLLKRTDVPSAWIRWVLFAIDGKTGSDNVFFTEIPHKKWIDEHDLSRFAKWFETNGQTGLRGLWRPLDEIYRALPEKEQLRYESSYRNYLVQLDNLTINLIRSLDPKNVILADILDLTLEEGHQHIAGITIDNVFVIHFGLKDFFPTLETDAFEIPAIRFYKQNGRYGVYRGSLVEPPEIPEGIKWLEDGKPIKYEIKVSPTSKSGNIALVKKGSELIIASDIPGEVFVQLYFIKDAIKVPIKVQTMPRRNLALEYLKFAGILGWFLLSLYNINTGREALKEASEHPIYPLIQGLFWTWVLFAVVTPIAAYLKYKTIKSIRKGVTRAEVRESESSAVSHQSSVGKVLSAEDRRLKTEDSKRAEVLEGKEMDESLKAKAMSQESKALSAQELLKQLEEEYQYNLYQKAKARLSWQVTGTMFLVFFSIFVVQSGFKHVYEHYAFWVSYISLLYSLNGLAKNWFLSRRNNQIKSAIELLKQHSSDDALIKMISEQLLPKQSKPHRAEARQTDRRVNAESQAEVRQDLWRAEVRSGEGVGLPVELKTPEILALIELVKKESTAYRGAIQALMPSEASIRSNLDEARKQFEADLKQFHRFVSHPDFRRLSSGIGRPVDWSKVNWQKIIDELRAIDEDKGFKIIWGFSSAWNTAEDLGIHVLRPVEVWLDDRNLTHIASALFDKRLSGQDIADETRRFLDRIRHDKFLKRAVLDVLTSGGEAPPQKRITSLLAAYFGALKYGSEFYFANVIHGDERLRLIGLLASEVVKMMPERVIEEKASVDQLVGEPGEQAGEIVATVQKVPTHQDRVPEAPKSPPAPMIERAATSPVPKVERARTVYHITPSPNIDGTVEDLKKELASTQGARDIVLVFQELVKAIFQTHEVEVPNEKKPGTRKQPITIKFIKWHTTRSTDEGLKIPGEVILAISIERIGENTIGLRREGSAVLVSWKSTSEAVFNELMKKVRAYFKNLQSVEVTDYRFSSLKQLETLTVHPRSEVRGENRRSEARKEINLDLSFSVDSKWIYLGVGQRRFATPRQNVRQIGTRDFGQPEIFQVTDEGVGNLILDHDVSEFIHRAYSVLFNYYGFSKGASPTDMGKTLAITMGALTNPEVLSGVSLPLRITYETNRIIVTSNPVGQFMMDLNTGQGRYESRNLKAEHAFYVMWSELGYYLPVFIDERALTVFREQIKQAPRSLPNLLQALRKGYEHARSEARLPSGQVRKEEIIERGGVWKGSRKSLLQLKGEKLSQRLSGPQRAYTNDLLEQGKVSSLVQILPQNLAQQLPAETDQPLERSQKLTPLSQRTLTYPLLTGQETPGGNSSKVETLIPIEVRKVVEGPRDWVLPYRLGHSELKRAWDGFFATAYAATLDRGKFDQAKSIIGISSNASYAYILGPGFFIDDGGAAFFVQNVFGNSPAAVVIRNESDRANVDEVNMELIKAGRQPILIAGSVEEAQQKLHAYIASRSEVRAQSYSFMGIVSSFEPLAEKLMQALKDNIILMTRGIFKHFKELTGLDESVIAEWKARFQMAKSA